MGEAPVHDEQTTQAGNPLGASGTASEAGILEERKLRSVRRVIARRLSQIWQEAPHVTLHRELDATGLGEARARTGHSAIDVILWATTRALVRYPEFNATFDGEVHRLYAGVHLGYAVDTPRGLVVPVLRDAAARGIDGLAAERKRMIATVMEGRFEMSDVEGGTFTVTNLGTMGVDFFTPILNPPQVAILGLGRLKTAAVGWGPAEAPKVRELLPVSLSFDHRVIDGARAAVFLQAIQEELSSLLGAA